MASWVVTCPECAHTFTHTANGAGLIKQAYRDPFHILPRPQVRADEKRPAHNAKRNLSTYALNFSTVHKLCQRYRFNAIRSCGRPPWMFGARMRLERFVALPFVIPLHFLSSVADQRS
jgi:hypothetical protein